jgi:hypothetical protein
LRKHAVWFVTLPLALVGVEAAHAAANAMFGPPSAELFETPSSGEGLLPFVAALVLGAMVAGLVARIAGAARSPHRTRGLAAPFVFVAPVAFVVLELGEALAAGQANDPSTWLTPTFAAGLVLQAPVALCAYVVARLLLRLGDELGDLVARVAVQRLWTFCSLIAARAPDRLEPALLSAHASARGPPSSASP